MQARTSRAIPLVVLMPVGWRPRPRATPEGEARRQAVMSPRLANMESRAKTLGGMFAVTGDRGGGTHLEWRVAGRTVERAAAP
jgi:hypothetical protein